MTAAYHPPAALALLNSQQRLDGLAKAFELQATEAAIPLFADQFARAASAVRMCSLIALRDPGLFAVLCNQIDHDRAVSARRETP